MGESHKDEFSDDELKAQAQAKAAGAQVDMGGAPAAAAVPKRERTQETFKREQPKVGRNDPCPCGSGKKYKHCCGKNA